jgi:DNA mismatch repair protein MutL
VRAGGLHRGIHCCPLHPPAQAIRDAGFGTESQVNWQSLYEVQESLPESPKLFEDASETAFKEFIVSGKFIIATTNNGILLIDSKKAMERIYYDQVIQSFISQPLHHQMLLFPIEKKLAKNEIRAITTHTNILTQLGFQFTLNEEILEIIGAPEIIEESGILECFEALITTLNFQDQDQGDLAHILVREMTKQSSKFIQIKSNEEAQYVMEKLFASEEPNVSPSNESILKMIPFDQLSNLLK